MKIFAQRIATACALALMMTAPAAAQQAWKLASAAQPGSVLIGYVDEVASKINAGAGGQIKVDRLFVGSEQEIIQQLSRGRLEMRSVSYTGASVLVPEAALLNMPYLS